MTNCFHWIRINRLKGGDLTLANIYAPNDMAKICMFWVLMIKELPKDCRWNLSGGFKMVEHHSNKTNECGRTIIDKESLLWEAMKNSLNVIKHPRSPYNLLFLWDNCRMDGNKILSLLDQMNFPLGSTFQFRMWWKETIAY